MFVYMCIFFSAVYDYPVIRGVELEVYANDMAVDLAPRSPGNQEEVEYLSIISANSSNHVEDYLGPVNQLHNHYDIAVPGVNANIAYNTRPSEAFEENAAYNVYSEREDPSNGYASIRENWLWTHNTFFMV